MSDGNNPYHVHEYLADELERTVADHFTSVEMLGVGATEEILRFHRLRLQRVESIVRLDVLRLRERLPRPWIEFAYGRLAVLVRRLTRRKAGGMPEVSWRDFPIGECSEECLDLLAVCTR